jgi:hypothetical protein
MLVRMSLALGSLKRIDESRSRVRGTVILTELGLKEMSVVAIIRSNLGCFLYHM